ASGELQVDDGSDVVAAVAVLGDSHAPDDDGAARLAERCGETVHVCPGLTGIAFQHFPWEASRLGFDGVPAHGSGGDELAVYPVVLEEMFQDPVEECNVAAHMHL